MAQKIKEEERLRILKSHRLWLESGSKEGERAILLGTDLSSTVFFDANLRDAILTDINLSNAKLHGANLTHANLRGANLSRANLNNASLELADLSSAKLQGATLRNAWLITATLISANLINADLRGANLSFASFANANLSGADLSGACLDDANFSGWIIKDIVCTHIIQHGQRIDFAPGEFEKKYTWLESVAEIVLNLPASDLTYYAGQMMAAVVGHKVGAASGSIILRTMQAQSNDSTRLEFLAMQKEMFEPIRQAMADLQEAFREHRQEIKALMASQEDEPEAVGLRASLPIPCTPYEVRPRDIEKILNQQHTRLVRPLQVLAEIIDNAAKKILP